MLFANSTYLWALLGLLIPLVIHLWNNKEGKVIKVGSIKFLNESDSSQSRSIKLNEYLLLFVRLALLVLLVFIISEPQLKRETKNKSLIYIVEPSLLANDSFNVVIDSLNDTHEVRALYPGFPDIDKIDINDDINKTPNYWQLAQQLEDLKTDSIVVFAKGMLTGIKGMRPTLNKSVEWIIINNEPSEIIAPIGAYKNDEKVDMISAIADDKHLAFLNQTVSLNSQNIEVNSTEDSILYKSQSFFLKDKPKLDVLLYYDEKLKEQVGYFEASLKAITKYTDETIKFKKNKSIDSLDIKPYNLLIWLSTDSYPTSESTILKYKPDEMASNTIEISDTDNLYYLTKLLTANEMVEDKFTEQLLELLNRYNISDKSLNTIDRRIISKNELTTNFVRTQQKIVEAGVVDLSKWLWLPFILILIIERVLAKTRRQ